MFSLFIAVYAAIALVCAGAFSHMTDFRELGVVTICAVLWPAVLLVAFGYGLAQKVSK